MGSGPDSSMQRIFSKIIGTSNDRAIKRLFPLVDEINAFESSLTSLSDAELAEKTPYLRGRLEQGESLDDLLFGDSFLSDWS